MKLKPSKLVAALVGAAVLTLAGCGGGGGGTTTPTVVTSTMLSGTVAGGAAVIGNVIVTDSKGATKSAPIEANGRYTIDVSGMTGPFMLKAAGTVGNTSVTYYSAATQADVGGTVNVTPFTDLIVSNIAAQMAETYFADPANVAKIGTLITPAALIDAQLALKAKLQPVLTAMGISDSIDLLRTSFAADHSGMDAVLDLVKVETNTATNLVTLTNALTSITIATDNVTIATDDATPVDSTKIAEITPAAATDLQTVMAKLDGFSKLFATGLPTPEALAASGVFDTSSNFMMSGATFAQFASELSTEPSAVGLKFSNVDISPDANNTPGVLILTTLISSNTDTFKEKIRLKMVKVNGVWLVQGDGRKADIEVKSQAQFNTWTNYDPNSQTSNSGSNKTNGLHVWIDPFAYNSNVINGTFAGSEIVSAVVTGPGLGANGVTFDQDTQNTWLKLANQPYSTNLIPECTTVITTQCVNIANTVDNGVYTLVLKNANNVSVNGDGYRLNLAKKPYATSDLTDAMFPAFTSITIDGQPITPSLITTGKTVAATWTMPAGLRASYANVWASGVDGTEYFRVEKDLLPTATSALFDFGTQTGGTPSSAGIWLEGIDLYGRSLAVSK